MTVTVYPLDFTGQGANAQNTLSAFQLPTKGSLRSLAFLVLSAGVVPHGRYFVRVWLLSGPFANSSVQATLYAGYLAGSGACSFPEYELFPNASIVVQITSGTKGTTSDKFRLQVAVSDGPAEPEGRQILSEPVGAGVGELIQLHITDPAAGADISHTVPANVLRKLRAIHATFTASSHVANRTIWFRTLYGGNYVTEESLQLTPVAATQIALIRWQQGAPVSQNLTFAVTSNDDVIMPRSEGPTYQKGDVWASLTVNLDAADQWSPVAFSFEEWANPDQ